MTDQSLSRLQSLLAPTLLAKIIGCRPCRPLTLCVQIKWPPALPALTVLARNKRNRTEAQPDSPAEPGRKPGFDLPVILTAGIGSGVLAGLIHQGFILTDAIYGEFGPFLYLFGYYFSLIIILFVTIAWFRRRRHKMVSFMDILVHSIVICLLAASVHSTYDYSNAQLNPGLAEEMLNRQEARLLDARAGQDSIMVHNQQFGQQAEQAKGIIEDLDKFIILLREQRQLLQQSPPSLGNILLTNLSIYLLFGLFWGSITGVLFKHTA